MSADTRFSGSLGEEYELFQRAVPHHEEFQGKVTDIVRAFVGDKEVSTLVIVEAGTGTGITTECILSAHPDIHVRSLDTEEHMLSKARERLVDFSRRVTLIHEDILTYLREQNDQSIDAFISAYTIHNFDPDVRSELMQEVARTLKQGGLYLNADKYALDDKEEHIKSLRLQQDLFRVFGQFGRPDLQIAWLQHYLEDDHIRFSEAEQRELLAEAFPNLQTVYRNGMEAIMLGKKL